MEWSTSKNGMEFILLIHDQICYGIHSIPFIFGTDGSGAENLIVKAKRNGRGRTKLYASDI